MLFIILSQADACERGGAWINFYKYMEFYDENFNNTQLIIQHWKNEDWVNTDRTDYFWSEFYPDDINEETANTLIISPNPAENKLTINSPLVNTGAPFTITIYNMLGKKVYSEKANSSTGNYQLDVSRLPMGMYLFELSNNRYKASGKLIKK